MGGLVPFSYKGAHRCTFGSRLRDRQSSVPQRGPGPSHAYEKGFGLCGSTDLTNLSLGNEGTDKLKGEGTLLGTQPEVHNTSEPLDYLPTWISSKVGAAPGRLGSSYKDEFNSKIRSR